MTNLPNRRCPDDRVDCPSDEDLSAFACDQLEAEQVETVADIVDACTECDLYVAKCEAESNENIFRQLRDQDDDPASVVPQTGHTCSPKPVILRQQYPRKRLASYVVRGKLDGTLRPAARSGSRDCSSRLQRGFEHCSRFGRSERNRVIVC